MYTAFISPEQLNLVLLCFIYGPSLCKIAYLRSLVIYSDLTRPSVVPSMTCFSIRTRQQSDCSIPELPSSVFCCSDRSYKSDLYAHRISNFSYYNHSFFF